MSWSLCSQMLCLYREYQMEITRQTGEITTLPPNFDDARTFLETLAGQKDAEFTFQTFDDSGEKNRSITGIIHGTFDEVSADLAQLNQNGAGIFVTVNQTDGTGRRKENVISVRAVFVDSDSGPIPEPALQPSMLIQTKRGQHAYWVLCEGEDMKYFTSTQVSLSKHLNTDPSVKDLSRVMRVPGFFHMKDRENPFLVKLITTSPVRYTFTEILSTYPADRPSERQTQPITPATSEQLEYFLEWAATLPSESSHENRLGGRNETLVVLIREGLGQNIPEAALREIVHAYCDKSKLPKDEADSILDRHIRQHTTTPFVSFHAERQQSGPFEVTDDGVFFIETTDDGEVDRHRICSRLDVTAHTRDAQNAAWGRLLRWQDRDGHSHEWAMPMEMLKGDGSDYRGILLDGGLDIAPGTRARNRLTEYIQVVHPKETARCVNRIGWHENAFVLPNRSFGPKVNGERVILQTVSDSHPALRSSGTLHEWQENVASFCTGNSRLVFAVSVAFAAPLLFIANEESGGFHLRGASSLGKTTALHVAGSVWGGGGINGYVQKWRATVNGLEAVAQSHCDSVLLLDELAEVDPRDAGKAAYMLANGSGKNRADRYGGARRRAEWRILYISSGEISLADHMSEAGQRTKAGQETRLIDLPADAEKRLGLFEDLHGMENGAVFAKQLVNAAQKYFGCAIIAFLENLVADELVRTRILEFRRDFLRDANLGENVHGQIHRIAARFALIAAAGELAITYGIVPWPRGEARRAVQACLSAWLSGRGGTGDLDLNAAIDGIRAFIQQNPGRLPALREDDSEVIEDRNLNRAGFTRKYTQDGKRRREWLMFSSVFTREICVGHDTKAVTRALLENGYLTPGTDQKPTKVVRVPALGRSVRFYVINDTIMGESDENS